MAATTASEYLTRLARRPRHSRPVPRDGLHALLARMQHPQRDLRGVHIVGSKGKGSTALMLDAMLRAAGRRTGVFTSPHIERWNERIRMHGAPVADARFDAILAELQPHVSALHAQCRRGPDFFEVLLVAALCLFQRADVDVAIVEAGVGARFDATMVVQPRVTALTSVELEHTASLGADVATIAADKAAVARPGVPLIIGRLPPSAAAVVRARAEAVGAPLSQPLARLLPNAHALTDDGCELPLPAPSQALADCAAIAHACLRALVRGADLTGVAQQGMQGLTLPGRLEVLCRQPLLVVDSAHTPASMAALVAALRAWGCPRTPLYLVLSCSGTRDLAQLAAPLLRQAEGVYLTRADATRSADPLVLAAGLHARRFGGAQAQVIEAPADALAAAWATAPSTGIVCATGSAYMAGAARRWFRGGKSV